MMDRSGTITTIPEEPKPADPGEQQQTPVVDNLIDVDVDIITKSSDSPLLLAQNTTTTSLEDNYNEAKLVSDQTAPSTRITTANCENCKILQAELEKLRPEKAGLEGKLEELKHRLETNSNELEREVQRRVDLEQKFTEEAKRTTDQIEELISKSDRDDSKLHELKKKFELYSRETSSMIENFTTHREILTSQLLELRKENDYLLGKYIGKASDLQSEEINLPQSVEELQFHCLTLNEKLILATLAKERLEETMVRDSNTNDSMQ